MKYGLLSGITWGIDTVILGVACALYPFLGAEQTALASAFIHDVAAALILFVFMGARGRLGDTLAAFKTRSGRVVMLAALLGGPVGMSGYLLAINNIGAGYTAAISAFYPAVGAMLAMLILKERMAPRQLVALLVALLGVVAMGWSSTGAETAINPLLGIFGALLCVFGWGSEAVILAWGMRDDLVDNETALQIRETTSALTYGLVVIPFVHAYGLVFQASFTLANAIIVLAALAGTASYLFYYKGIDLIGASRCMALNISYVAWAVIFGVFTGVIPSAFEILCCAVIMVGTVLSATPDWSDFGLKKVAESTD